MDSEGKNCGIRPRRVRICRPALQDMHHLVMPRLAARAQLRRHAMKLRFWVRDDEWAGDLECVEVSKPELFALRVSDGFGLAGGFQVVFCELSMPEPDGTLCVLSVMATEELFTVPALTILRSRAAIARERLRGNR